MRKLKYILLRDITYYSKRYDISIKIPKGFIWDGCSGFLIRDMYPYTASMIHDYLYITHQLTRLQSDVIYYDILKACGTPIVAIIRLIGLRCISWAFWDCKYDISDFIKPELITNTIVGVVNKKGIDGRVGVVFA